MRLTSIWMCTSHAVRFATYVVWLKSCLTRGKQQRTLMWVIHKNTHWQPKCVRSRKKRCAHPFMANYFNLCRMCVLQERSCFYAHTHTDALAVVFTCAHNIYLLKYTRISFREPFDWVLVCVREYHANMLWNINIQRWRGPCRQSAVIVVGSHYNRIMRTRLMNADLYTVHVHSAVCVYIDINPTVFCEISHNLISPTCAEINNNSLVGRI